MEIRFTKTYLEELYYTGKTKNKKYRFQLFVVEKYRKIIDLLESISKVEDLYRYKSLNYKALIGDKAGIESVRINNQYRLELKITQDVQYKILVCDILELSNHYK